MTLVRCAQAGDRAAFDVLADRYRALILAVTFLRTGSKDEAEDLTQEVFAKAWVHLPALKEPAAFVAWLRRIAANACRDWYRRGYWPASLVELTSEMPSEAPGPHEIVIRRAHQNALRQALLELPEKNRIALLLFTWGGYSYERIAVLLDIPITTVEGRIFRARQQLKQLLSSEVDRLSDRPRTKWHAKGGKA